MIDARNSITWTHDPDVIQQQLPCFSSRGDNFFVLGLGSDFNVSALGQSLQEYYPAAVRFVSRPEELQSSFEHFARTSRRIVGSRCLVAYRAAPGFVCREAYSLLPHDFPIVPVIAEGWSYLLGPIEFNKRYSFIMMGSLAGTDTEGKMPTGCVEVSWCDARGTENSIRHDILVERTVSPTDPAKQEFDLWTDLVSRHRELGTTETLRALRATRIGEA